MLGWVSHGELCTEQFQHPGRNGATWATGHLSCWTETYVWVWRVCHRSEITRKAPKQIPGLLPAKARLLCAPRPTGDKRTRAGCCTEILQRTGAIQVSRMPSLTVWKTKISQTNEIFAISSLNFISRCQGHDLSNGKYFPPLFILYWADERCLKAAVTLATK